MPYHLVCVQKAMTYWLEVGVDGFYVRGAAYLVEQSDISQDSLPAGRRADKVTDSDDYLQLPLVCYNFQEI